MTLTHKAVHGDCLELLKDMPDNSVDLILCSPPYEDARLYDELQFKLVGQKWVDWSVARYLECVRVSRGLVAWVVEGKTKNFRWSATPALLMADLHRAGVNLRKPSAFHRVGIPGSGGPDWLRNDYEFIVCSTKPGKLPWSDNTAMGHPPKWAPGGAMSNRKSNGSRVRRKRTFEHTKANGEIVIREDRQVMSRDRPGTHLQSQRGYTVPAVANPGNVIHCKVGGGLLGSKLAHENEAPFPNELAEFFIRSFCPPGGIVLDPFCGSGTTLSVAHQHERNSIGFDHRQSQVDLTYRRLAEVGYTEDEERIAS